MAYTSFVLYCTRDRGLGPRKLLVTGFDGHIFWYQLSGQKQRGFVLPQERFRFPVLLKVTRMDITVSYMQSSDNLVIS
jgi:hypothetical protein